MSDFHRWATALLLLAASGCAREAPDPDPLPVLGAVLPLSGPYADAGTEVLAGLRMAAASPGQLAFELRVADGLGTPTGTLAALQLLAADSSVVGIVGGWIAANGRILSAAPLENPPVRLLLSPLAFTGPSSGGDGVFALHRIESLGVAAAGFAREDLGASLAGIVGSDASEASRLLRAGFAHEFEGEGGRILWTLSPDPSGRVAPPPSGGERPDVVFVAGPSDWAGSVPIPRGRRESPPAFLFPEGWNLDAAASLGEKGAAAYRVSFFSDTGTSPGCRRLREECTLAGVRLTPALAAGWDAARLLSLGMARGGASRSGLAGALPFVEGHDGASGPVPVSRSGTLREAPAVSSLGGGGPVFLRRVEAILPAED
ncbi:MAG: ABC transporter substrate-binding protein [Gemmatimonadota bacterium]|jgi:hypothetical protein|nr:ABC transporter substrate-binding protein [Gemmatimonadota bacterium]MDP6802743.1 ABC transporter substrate-binding protein [Gemmatimonadota bacterium]MDP7031736.1 ABC transporter substrate-binding protein [Gemmatimonadota bacterium]